MGPNDTIRRHNPFLLRLRSCQNSQRRMASNLYAQGRDEEAELLLFRATDDEKKSSYVAFVN